MASGTATFTIDTNEWTYVDTSGVPHVVTNGQTFTVAVTDTSASIVTWIPTAGGSVSCTDGTRLYFGADPTHRLEFADTDDGAAKLNPGTWIIRDPQTHQPTQWKCRTATIDNVDSPSSITATFEQVQNPMRIFTWTSVDIAYA